MVIIAAFMTGYFMTGGTYTVPATVETDPSIPRIALNNTLFHTEIFGREKDPLVIVLHGGPGADFRYLLPLKELSDRYRVLFYDQRGTGLSARNCREKPTLESSISDLNAMIERFGKGKKVNIIGHSWGAMLAAVYAGRYPARIDHLVLAEPGFLTADTANVFLQRTKPSLSISSLSFMIRTWLQSLHIKAVDDHARRDFIMGRFMTAYDGTDHPLQGYFCEARQSEESKQVWRFGYEAMESIIRSGMDDNGHFTADFTGGLKKFKGKVLFLSGECNTITGKDQQIRNMTHFPWAELVVLKDTGHYMLSENPREAIAVIRQYFHQRP